MSRTLSAALLAGLAFGWTGGAAARPGDPPPASAAAVQQQEAEALAKASDDMVELARFCAGKGAFDDARRTYGWALEFNPKNAAVQPDLDKLKFKKNAPKPGAADQIGERRYKTLAACVDLFSPVALAYVRADRAEDTERIVALLRGMEAPIANLDLAWFEPYLAWFSKKEVAALTAGGEFVDGAWIDAAKVAELDHVHAAWSAPWTLSDDVHELRTTQPLRIARQAFARVSAARRALLRYFQGEWDLRAPPAKLRVFLVATHAELEERMRAECPTAAPFPREALACYVDDKDPCAPCFAVMESLDAKGRATKLDFTGVRWHLVHETVRQVAFEYSKHMAGPARAGRRAAWAVEGMAEFMGYVRYVNGACVVTRPGWIPSGGKEVDAAFSWCRSNVDKIPPLDEFFGMPRQKFDKAPENRRIAATLAWFLLEGAGRVRRAGFAKFLAMVHQDRDEADSFTECVKGTPLPTIDAEFREFCRTIVLDEK